MDMIVNRSFNDTPVEPVKWILLIELIMVPCAGGRPGPR